MTKQKKQPQESLVSKVTGGFKKAIGLGPKTISPELARLLDNNPELGKAMMESANILKSQEERKRDLSVEQPDNQAHQESEYLDENSETPITGLAPVRVLDSNPDSYESFSRSVDENSEPWNQIPRTEAIMRILMTGSMKPESDSDPLKDAIELEKVYQTLEREFPEESQEIKETSNEYERITQEKVKISGENLDSVRSKIKEVLETEHPSLKGLEKEYIIRSAAVKIYNENPSPKDLNGVIIDTVDEEIDYLGDSINHMNKIIKQREKQRFRKRAGGLTAAVLATGLLLAGSIGGMSYLLGNKSNSKLTPITYSQETREKTNKLETNVLGIKQDVNKQSQEIQEVKETLQGNKETPGLIQDVQEVNEKVTEYGEKFENVAEEIKEQTQSIHNTIKEEARDSFAKYNNLVQETGKDLRNEIGKTQEDFKEIKKTINTHDKILKANSEDIKPEVNNGYSNPLGASKNLKKPKHPNSRVTGFSLINERETSKKESDWQLRMGAYTGAKFALNYKEDKPDTMPIFGVEARLNKRDSNRLGLYGALEFGQMDDSKSDAISRAELDSSTYTGRIGLDYKVVDSDKVKLIAGVGGRVTKENNSGYLELATQTGTQRMDINDSNTLFGLETNLGVEATLNDRFSLEAGATYGHNFNSDNVRDDLKATFKFNIHF